MTAETGAVRVAVIGAGFIARVHLAVLAGRGARVVAVCDADRGRASALARAFGIRRVFGSVDELLASGGIDAVHVLVPPAAHAAVVDRCLDAGCHVLCEKPMALAADDAARLGELAVARGRRLAVNHNLVWHPGCQRLRRDLASGRLGRLEHVALVHNTPLRQLQTGDTGHFMFGREDGILLEQGVHLFSLVRDLCGPAVRVRATCGPALRLASGNPFRDEWQVAIEGSRATAHVTMNFGRAFPATTLEAIGSDGAVRVDLVRGGYQRLDKSRWLDAVDHARNFARLARQAAGQSVAAVGGYARALFRLGGQPDPFTASMAASIDDFYAALARGTAPRCDAERARDVLAMCDEAARAAGVGVAPFGTMALADAGPPRDGEVLVTGGTGFIGRYLIPELQREELPVTLLVRDPRRLPAWVLALRGVRIVGGDATDAGAVDRAAEGVEHVVHMATCAGDDPERIEQAMVAGVRAVGEACLRHGVRRLIFVSSTAALYLGGFEPVRGGDGPDRHPTARPAYARGKIAAERALAELQHGRRALRAVVLRPAVVVGAGGIAEHSGAGLWVRDNHCVGWGSGTVPLPFVLARDVASAIVHAIDADGIDGRAYNLAGDVRITAVDYVTSLRTVTDRDYAFHPQPLWVTWAVELGKWLIKRVAGRRGNYQSLRDLRSRAFLAPLDCRDAKRDLGWQPEHSRAAFLREAVDVHARPPARFAAGREGGR